MVNSKDVNDHWTVSPVPPQHWHFDWIVIKFQNDWLIFWFMTKAALELTIALHGKHGSLIHLNEGSHVLHTGVPTQRALAKQHRVIGWKSWTWLHFCCNTTASSNEQSNTCERTFQVDYFVISKLYSGCSCSRHNKRLNSCWHEKLHNPLQCFWHLINLENAWICYSIWTLCIKYHLSLLPEATRLHPCSPPAVFSLNTNLFLFFSFNRKKYNT